ncbi:MAG: hypothetical protein ACHREM_22115 [Polyangiales bacterium]
MKGSTPILVSGEAVRAFGSRLSIAMTTVGALGMLLAISPLWASPWLRGQGYFWLLFTLFAWLTSTGAGMFLWYRVRGAPPTSALLTMVLAASSLAAAAIGWRAHARIDLRERGLATELVWPAVRLLRERPNASDDEVRASTAHDDQRPMRIFRRADGDARAVVAMGGGSIDRDGTWLVALLSTTTFSLDWSRATSEAEVMTKVRALLGEPSAGEGAR